MTRLLKLKKLASGKIELFHTTSSQVLQKIKESGSLLPSGETGVVSNGLESENIPVEERTPSGNLNGIYLGSNEDVLNYYREKVVDATQFDKNMPNVPVDLKIETDTSNLVPDYDDMVVLLNDPDDEEELESLFDDNTPRWQTSIDEIEQVVHEGPIPVSDITGVRFMDEYVVADDESYNLIRETLNFNTWLSFDQATSQLSELEDKVKNLELHVASSRLRRVKRG
ncbi:gp233 [Bacillus phage G]|uniref:Gp233 n=1 Tax=Bacillus phage G TaxID=2884420 RepID=G3M9X4_9CAUD|nr:gp233 [Bacillus phage G]AEO93492.1 gp233 [Bacillus phage G]